MSIANASLLDEGTAAAEAMSMFYCLRKTEKPMQILFLYRKDCFPQTIDVLKTRANPLGIEILVGDHNNINLTIRVFGIILTIPN